MTANEPPADTHGSPSYALTQAERTYLRTGDPGAESKSNMEERIQTKVDRLGYRIDHLLADVLLLHSKDYLTEETWKVAWTGVLGLEESPIQPSTRRARVRDMIDSADPPSESDLVEACQVSSHSDIGRPVSGPSEFGRDLGTFARCLMLAPGDIELDTILQDTAYGFIEGLYVDHRPAGMGEQRIQQRRTYVNEVLTSLRKRLEQEVIYDREWAEWEREWRVQGDIWKQHRFDMITRLRETLDDEKDPICPHRSISEFRERVLEKRGEADAHETGVNERGIDCDDLLAILIDERIESDHPPGSFGQWTEFQGEFGPAEQFDPEEFVERGRVLSVIDDLRIMERGILNRYSAVDSGRIRDKKVRGLDALDVFSTIYEHGTRLSSKAIARQLGSETTYQGQVTQVCNDLAGRGWDERPVVTGSKDSWELTAYGQVLAHTMFEESSSALLRTLGPDIDTDVITQAASEVNELVDWEYDGKQ